MPSARAVFARALRLVLCTALAVCAVLTAALRAGAEPAPSTPLPSTSADAKAAADAAAAEVARVEAKVKKQIADVSATSRAAQQAEAAYQTQLIVEADARRVAIFALIDAARADAAYAAADRRLRMVVAQQYESGGGMAVNAAHLLTADDPSQLIGVAESEQQIGEYQAVLVQRATTARNASAAAHDVADAAFHAQQAATAQVKLLRDQAASKYDAAHAALLALRQQLTKARTSQAEANTVLSMFLGGWTIADPARAAALNRQYLEYAAEVAHRPLAPRSAHWTPQMGESAVWRAVQEIGLPYAWAGGGASGPSRGVCAKGDAELDCQKIGFDCSGLTMYGWGPYLSMAHYAATQYGYGHLHPTPNQLLPGDLLFWSSDNTVKGIHHVAMYVGAGNVIQAPNSGDIVRITPLNSVSAGYFGATRPLT